MHGPHLATTIVCRGALRGLEGDGCLRKSRGQADPRKRAEQARLLGGFSRVLACLGLPYTTGSPRIPGASGGDALDSNKRKRWNVGEDWLSVIIGLALVALAWVGVVRGVPWPLFGWFGK